jgi:hypothetical protein
MSTVMPAPWTLRYGPRFAAVVVLGLGIFLLVVEGSIRTFEAHFSALVLSLTGVARAQPMGYSVVFPQGHQWIGYSITAGCTATLLAVPFFFISSGLLLSRRVSITRGILGLAVVTTLVWMVNQLRLLLIGASMRLWGFRVGYERSHVLAGGILSTLGVAMGLAIFVVLIVRDRRPRQGAPSPELPEAAPSPS